MQLMNRSALAFQVILTKIDKIKEHELEKTLLQVREKLSKHPAAFPELVTTSSEKGEGIVTLRAIISDLI
jgi:GTP-binding protein